jgi:hypothetical protein
MNVLNFFKFLEDKEGRALPGRAKLAFDPNYIFNVEDFEDEYGNVDLSGNPNLISIPVDNLTVKGHLILINCKKLQSLPDNLTVGGGLYLPFCENLQSLPNNLTVNGTLDLEGCTSLQSLPKDLKVGKDLYISRDTLLAKKYTKEEIKQMCPGIKGDVYWS